MRAKTTIRANSDLSSFVINFTLVAAPTMIFTGPGVLFDAQLGGSSVQMPEYVRRFFQVPQMDIDYTLWQMLYLCVAPSRVYRTTKYHKQTKNQWARDGTLMLSLVPTVKPASYETVFLCERLCSFVIVS